MESSLRQHVGDAQRAMDSVSAQEQKRIAWVISSGKAGMVVHCKGIAEALGVDYEMKTVSPVAPWKWMAPWGGVPPWHRAGRPNGPLAQPWPDIAIASGRASIPYLMELKAVAGSKVFTVYLQDPRTNAFVADLVWAPEHDRLKGENVLSSLTSPHTHRYEKIEAIRNAADELLDSMPYPKVMLTLGGTSSAYKFTSAAINRLIRSVKDMGDLGASFLITSSRRTPEKLLSAVELATRNRPRVIWDGEGDNPYARFLAKADYLVVTADSANMTGEACVTGRPVYVFMPEGGSPKFNYFHEKLQEMGVTRALPERVTQLENWEYEPIDSTLEIAQEIKRRW